MSKILLLKGLPASGKSTFAKELARQSDWKRVNKDDIRAMADDSKWSKANEKLVIEWRDMLIWNSLANGYSVVVDDTNLHPKHLERMHQIAREFSGNKVEVEEKFFDVSVEECIKRDLGRNNSVGEKVIRTMYNQFVNSSQAPYVAPLEATDAIIVDIDGTLAHMNDRSPYDASKYSEDTADPTIVEMVNLYRDYFGDELSVIICSGRDDTYQL
jgi:predicted kinase